jgi:hypothetical protein
MPEETSAPFKDWGEVGRYAVRLNECRLKKHTVLEVINNKHVGISEWPIVSEHGRLRLSSVVALFVSNLDLDGLAVVIQIQGRYFHP